ncbi:MAG: tetratricopeptide repeat protein, partial [Okeania sp. SIO3B3]|nr:tetratricopeptide repeat protein [Okeania sp. SIO3B3]
VADHYVKGETWPRAFRYMHRAADAAIQSFANQQALEFYNRALDIAQRLGDDVDQPTLILVYEGRARVLARLGRPQHALDDYAIMRDKARALGDKSAQMRALNGVGALRMGYYDFPSALPFFEEALDLARTISDEPGMADTLNQLGNYYYSMAS